MHLYAASAGRNYRPEAALTWMFGGRTGRLRLSWIGRFCDAYEKGDALFCADVRFLRDDKLHLRCADMLVSIPVLLKRLATTQLQEHQARLRDRLLRREASRKACVVFCCNQERHHSHSVECTELSRILIPQLDITHHGRMKSWGRDASCWGQCRECGSADGSSQPSLLSEFCQALREIQPLVRDEHLRGVDQCVFYGPRTRPIPPEARPLMRRVVVVSYRDASSRHPFQKRGHQEHQIPNACGWRMRVQEARRYSSSVLPSGPTMRPSCPRT